MLPCKHPQLALCRMKRRLYSFPQQHLLWIDVLYAYLAREELEASDTNVI